MTYPIILCLLFYYPFLSPFLSPGSFLCRNITSYRTFFMYASSAQQAKDWIKIWKLVSDELWRCVWVVEVTRYGGEVCEGGYGGEVCEGG